MELSFSLQRIDSKFVLLSIRERQHVPRIYDHSDLTGKSFNRLTAVKFSHINKNGVHHWEFLCTCGNTKVIQKSAVKGGYIKSCGCLKKEVDVTRVTTHGQSSARKNKKTKIYVVWISLKARVKNKPGNSYIGATVSEEWKSFENFYRDMGDVPDGKSIDRIDSSKGYSKENTRWATRTEQARNTRKRFNGKTSSKYKGVILLKKTLTWKATIRTGEKRLELGTFKTEAAAALAYNEAAKKYHGEFACLNPI